MMTMRWTTTKDPRRLSLNKYLNFFLHPQKTHKHSNQTNNLLTDGLTENENVSFSSETHSEIVKYSVIKWRVCLFHIKSQLNAMMYYSITTGYNLKIRKIIKTKKKKKALNWKTTSFKQINMWIISNMLMKTHRKSKEK